MINNDSPPRASFNRRHLLRSACRGTAALALLAGRLSPEMNSESIHELLYELAAETGADPKAVFRAIYLALLGRERGPRAGWFLSSLDFEFLRERLEQASRSYSGS